MPLQVEILSAEGHLYSGQASMVIAPASQGEIGVAPQHAPLLTNLTPGELRIHQVEGGVLDFFVGGGILEVQPTGVTVLSDTAERSEDLDAEAAAKAKADAEERLEGQTLSDMEVAKARAELVEAAARLRLIEKLRNN